MNRLSKRTRGILFLLMSALGFAIMAIFVKLAGDLPTVQKVFFRNLITSVVSLIIIIKNRHPILHNKSSIVPLIFRSAFGVLGMLLYFYAMDNMVLSDANMINKLSTFFLLIFSTIFLKEKLKPYQVISVCIAFVGALFIIKPVFQLDIIPYLASLTAAIFAGAAYTFVRHLSQKEHFYSITFFFSSFSIIVLLPFVIIYYQAMTPIQLVYLLLAGIFASVGQFGITLAYREAPAKEISIFNYFNVIFVTILSYIVFLDYPDIYSIIGYLIIIGSSYYMFRKNQIQVRKNDEFN